MVRCNVSYRGVLPLGVGVTIYVVEDRGSGVAYVFERQARRLDRSVYHVYDVAVTSRDIISRLKADGWILVHTRGSHHQFKHPDRSGRVTVPHPKKDLPKGTLRSIFR